MTQNSSQKSIHFLEKYALCYYISIFQFVIVWTIYLKTHQPSYILAYMMLQNYVGKLLPKDSNPVTNSALHNKSIFHVFPLVVNLLCTWTSVAIIFIDYPVQNYDTHQTISLILCLGLMLSPSIDASHQLIHRPQTIFKALGFINLIIFQFTVYPIEHLYLHHKYVGTAKDPITSPKNQSYYVYTIKAYLSAHKFVFNHSKLAFLGCMLANWTYLFTLFFFAWKQFHDLEAALRKVGFFVIVGIVGYCFMETIEYIEHYGLVYREDKDKKQINEISSWNSEESVFYNWMIFRFQRHSDHHMNAYKIFTTLELTDKMPKFPFNFIQGIFICFFPPIWYYVMNPYVDEVLEKKPVSKQHRTYTKYIYQGLYLLATLNSLFTAYRYHYGLLWNP